MSSEMTPAQELREAAKAMRADASWPSEDFAMTVANWLDIEAGILEKGLPDPTAGWAEARAVARAYTIRAPG
jgi:hypothetical protein